MRRAAVTACRAEIGVEFYRSRTSLPTGEAMPGPVATTTVNRRQSARATELTSGSIRR